MNFKEHKEKLYGKSFYQRHKGKIVAGLATLATLAAIAGADIYENYLIQKIDQETAARARKYDNDKNLIVPVDYDKPILVECEDGGE
jgi:hypothetical protein